MNIENWASFFHDGSILAISHQGNKLSISMESAEMDEKDVKDDVMLTGDDRIRGQLHIEGIKAINENGETYLGILKMKDQDAEILHFEFNEKKVVFDIIWSCFPQKPEMKDFSNIEIQAEKIWWENLPNLVT